MGWTKRFDGPRTIFRNAVCPMRIYKIRLGRPLTREVSDAEKSAAPTPARGLRRRGGSKPVLVAERAKPTGGLRGESITSLVSPARRFIHN
jgi:hypothetical protein